MPCKQQGLVVDVYVVAKIAGFRAWGILEWDASRRDSKSVFLNQEETMFWTERSGYGRNQLNATEIGGFATVIRVSAVSSTKVNLIRSHSH